MARTALQVLALTVLVVLAGCGSLFDSPGPTAAGSATRPDSPGVSYEALENATLWIDGHVERVDNRTVVIDDQAYSDVLVPVHVRDGGGVFRCEPTNDSGLDCTPIEIGVVTPGTVVCANVRVTDGSLTVIKIFFNATCGGPQTPPRGQ